MPVINFDNTAVLVAPITINRNEIHLQNTGDNPIYFTKFKNNAVPNIPSPTNYDLILYPSTVDKKDDDKDNEGNKGIEFITDIYIMSVAGIRAYCPDEAVLTYFETIKVGG